MITRAIESFIATLAIGFSLMGILAPATAEAPVLAPVASAGNFNPEARIDLSQVAVHCGPAATGGTVHDWACGY